MGVRFKTQSAATTLTPCGLRSSTHTQVGAMGSVWFLHCTIVLIR